MTTIDLGVLTVGEVELFQNPLIINSAEINSLYAISAYISPKQSYFIVLLSFLIGI